MVLSVNKVSLSFGGHDVFNDIAFQINNGDRIGLVGRNGAGKSTLLRLIAGEYTPDAGNISTPSEFRLAYLKQELLKQPGLTVLQLAEKAFDEIKRIEKRLDDINHALVVRIDYETQSYHDLLDELHELNERFTMMHGHTYLADIEKILKGLGFQQADFKRPLSTFSGGWQMRAELARLLLSYPDLLLLDEPTNHLDIESIIWLEEYLAQSNQTVVVVSHDRTFLDNVTNRTIEISLGRTYDFNCPYSKYVQQRAEIQEKQISAQKNQEKEIKQTEMLINKFRAKASKASFAQSLIKKLDKMDRIEVDVDDTRSMHFRFPPAPRSGKVIVKGENLEKHYGDNQVFKNVGLEIERGQRVAFVGQNGQGKSTLVKIFTEKLAHGGHLELGHNVQIGYYAQDQADSLDGDKTVLATIEDAANEEMRKRARDLLGSFMFTGDDATKKVKVLSGGERGRLAMCKLLLQPINFLVMDEPTNHLDMRAKDVLKQALLQFDGTLLVVSHDREFLEGLVNRVYEFRDGKVKPYLGGIEYFLEQRKLDSMRTLEKRSEEKAAAAVIAAAAPSKHSFAERKELEKDNKRIKNRISKVEEEIALLEGEIAVLDAALLDPEKFKELSKDPNYYSTYEAKKSALEKVMTEWEELAEQAETTEQQLNALS
jgi:ATP-binding cassette subfamily F protein 3